LISVNRQRKAPPTIVSGAQEFSDFGEFEFARYRDSDPQRERPRRLNNQINADA